MADKNLHDIKIDDLDNPKKTPLKNILTLLALLFIILVISVVITKLILNTDEEVVIDNNSSTTSIIETDSNKEGSSDAVTATAATVAGAAAVGMLANTSTPKDRNLPINETSTSTSTETSSNENEVKKDGGSKTKVTLRERQPEKVKELVTPKKSPVPKKVKPVVHKAPKKDTNSNQYVDKVVAKKVPSHVRSSEAKIREGYYIKVGAFKDTSTAVNKIKKTGLNYSLIKTKNDTTVTRVLIGPFKSNWGAQQHLPSVKSNIAEGAYITRIN